MDMMPPYATQALSPVHEFAEVSMWKPPQIERYAGHEPTPMTGRVSAFLYVFPGSISRATPTVSKPAEALVHTIEPAYDPLVGDKRAAEDGATSELDRIAQERIRLMAIRSSLKSKNVELQARLEVLSQRLLDRSPTVTESQVAHLESVNDLLKELDDQSVQRKRRLGLTS